MVMQATDMGILNELSEFIALRMNSFYELVHDGDWTEHKAHYDYDLWFVRDGSVRIEMAGIEHTAAPGDVVFFYPGVPYIASTDAKGCRFIYIHFDFGIGDHYRILNDFRLSGIVPKERIREEAQLFARIFAQSRDDTGMPGNRLYLKACLMAVISRIVELHGRGEYSGAFPVGHFAGKSAGNLAALQPVFAYIREHLHRTMRMSELAAVIGVSEKYFISYFRKALGVTPGQYICQIKMNRARDYLCQKKYTVQQIAGFLGYPDPFTFSKAFKKHYNVSPSKFG